jgi:hypothetical protein
MWSCYLVRFVSFFSFPPLPPPPPPRQIDGRKEKTWNFFSDSFFFLRFFSVWWEKISVMCVDTLVLTDSQCAHCGIPLSSSSSSSKKSSSSSTKEEGKYKGMIELKREGTGFAAGGMAEGKRFDLSFQG